MMICTILTKKKKRNKRKKRIGQSGKQQNTWIKREL